APVRCKGWFGIAHPPGGSGPSSTNTMTAICFSLTYSSTLPSEFSSAATAPAKSASAKSQPSNVDRRRSAPRRIAPTNLQSLKLEARMSQPDKSAPLKSHSSKSFQHIRDSDRSELAKLTWLKPERPKNVRGRVRLLLSASSKRYRKYENPSSSSSWLGIRSW